MTFNGDDPSIGSGTVGACFAMARPSRPLARVLDGFLRVVLAWRPTHDVFDDPERDPRLSAWRAYRRRQQDARIAEEADVMISDFGGDAYFEARRREMEASDEKWAQHWGLVALMIARKMYGAGGDEP